VSTSVGQGGTGRVPRPVSDREMSSSALRRELANSCAAGSASGHKGTSRPGVFGPVPPNVPGEFVVELGAVVSAATLRGLEEGMGRLGGPTGLLSALGFVEVEARGFDEGLVEGLRLLRGAVMAVEAAGEI